MKMERNKKNILALAKLIEALPEEKFNMANCLNISKMDNETGRTVVRPPVLPAGAAWEEQGRPPTINDNGNVWNQGNNNLINSARIISASWKEEKEFES